MTQLPFLLSLVLSVPGHGPNAVRASISPERPAAGEYDAVAAACFCVQDNSVEEIEPQPEPNPDPAAPIFEIPDGLTMSVDCLLQRLGENPQGRLTGVPYPFTVDTCIKLSEQAIRAGLHYDAVAIARHGLSLPQIVRFQEDRKSLRFTLGVAQLATGDRDGCLKSMRDLKRELEIARNAKDGEILEKLKQLSARLNGPVVVRYSFAFLAVCRTSRLSTSINDPSGSENQAMEP